MAASPASIATSTSPTWNTNAAPGSQFVDYNIGSTSYRIRVRYVDAATSPPERLVADWETGTPTGYTFSISGFTITVSTLPPSPRMVLRARLAEKPFAEDAKRIAKREAEVKANARRSEEQAAPIPARRRF
ncbi:hypothetical protein ABW20_dc0101562 [Dactylellina cionopaga]|nr:hypothetical protein ABW20_dc0101562 [Dactylellina cionopaga]